ncbi:carbohydrate kinase family protein [Rhizobium binxianense]
MTFESDTRSAVLSIGRIYCDLIFTGLEAMPTLGRELFADSMNIAAGGGAFIMAAYSAHAGRKTALLSRLGTDALSGGIEAELAASGVDLRFLDRAADAGPQVTVAIVNGKERAFLSRRAGPAEPATLAAALAWPEARHLHIAEFATLAEIPGLVARAKANGLTVSLDSSWDEKLIFDKDFLARCAGVDVFLPNVEEATAITGQSDPAVVLERLAAFFPVVALKAGAEGAYLASDGRQLHRHAPTVSVVDTTGAGDAFNAGLLHAWLEGRDAERCLAEGIAMGSLAVQAAGGAAVLGR